MFNDKQLVVNAIVHAVMLYSWRELLNTDRHKFTRVNATLMLHMQTLNIFYRYKTKFQFKSSV